MLVICKQLVVKSHSRRPYTAITPIDRGDVQKTFNDFRCSYTLATCDSSRLARAWLHACLRLQRNRVHEGLGLASVRALIFGSEYLHPVTFPSCLLAPYFFINLGMSGSLLLHATAIYRYYPCNFSLAVRCPYSDRASQNLAQ